MGVPHSSCYKLLFTYIWMLVSEGVNSVHWKFSSSIRLAWQSVFDTVRTLVYVLYDNWAYCKKKHRFPSALKCKVYIIFAVMTELSLNVSVLVKNYTKHYFMLWCSKTSNRCLTRVERPLTSFNMVFVLYNHVVVMVTKSVFWLVHFC